MADLLQSLAQGLRGAAGVLSPTIQQQTFRQDAQREQMMQEEMLRRRNLAAQQIIKGAEMGAIDPEAAKAQLQQLGFGEIPVGPSAETQARQTAAARERELRRRLAAATTPEERRAIAMEFASPDKLIQATTEKPVSIGRGGALIPDGQGGWTRIEGAPAATANSTLSKLIMERNALAPDDPNRKIYDDAIRKQTTSQPAVNVYSSTLVPAIDSQGNQVFVQPSGREGVAPRVVEGVRPPESATTARTRRESESEQLTVDAVRQRVNRMAEIVQRNPTAVGPAGVARRIGEAIGGVGESLGGPQVSTPAIDFQNEQALLLADVRKLVEKDPNLSNTERERLYQTLGGGTFQTPSSAIRTLNNVLQYVEGKRVTGQSREARKERTAPAVGQVVDGYEYLGGDPSKQQSWRKK